MNAHFLWKNVVIISLLIGAGFMVWAISAPRHAPRSFVIEEGQNIRQISTGLRQQQVIHSPWLFRILIRLVGRHRSIQAGIYTMNHSYPLIPFVLYLSSDQAHPIEKTIRIIEGWNIRDIATYLAAMGYGTVEWDQAQLFHPTGPVKTFLHDTGAPDTASIEGYIFPDTYRVYQRSSLDEIIVRCLETFRRRVSPDLIQAFNRRNLSLHQAVTIASIVEKEVPATEDRKRVADIFLRRLSIGMPLQADSTVNYITQGHNASVNTQQLQIDSPYNTYRNKGLPPGPISNPSLDALNAVANPTPNPYLYFLTVGDPINDPQHVKVYYSTTFAEHQQQRLLYFGR